MKTFAQATDNQLITAFQSGDAKAMEHLVIRHKNKLFSYILHLVNDRHLAEDIFQDCFIKIINTIKDGRYNEEGKFIVWAMRVAHNMCIDYFRKHNKTLFVASDEKDKFEAVTEQRSTEADIFMMQRQSHDSVRKLIDLLPSEQREVIVLRHFADLSFKEIAEITNCSINTALGRMRYGLTNLRKMIGERQLSL
ncbi:MAG: RNA polymerase sigma factor [Chitinophagaceae bacterium]